ncbi:MAG: HlyD family efflux transporter periplasmic adaptor subunit [Bacillota bacterium]|nr:HlyD family efflux transporter periplasmic adaptor subunit [Bacillota bacterium]
MKEENKKKGIKLGALMLVLFLLMYIPSLFHWIYGKDITTDIIRSGSIEDSINLEGYIMRDEEVIESPFEGKYIPEVNEGEKLASNYKIATVLSDNSTKVLEELRKLDLAILDKGKKKSENQGLFSQDLIKLDNNISEKISYLAMASDSNDPEKLNSIKADIDAIIQKKAEILSGLGTSDSQINALKLQRDSLKAQIDASTKGITSSAPGIISFNIDGYENALNPSRINALKASFLEEIGKKDIKSITNLKSVEVNKPFAKIIKGIYIYIAVVMDKNASTSLKTGKSVNIRINDINKMINATPVKIMDEAGSKNIVVFKTDKVMSDTTYLRKINIDLIKNSFDGLQVSYKSLFDINGEGTKGKIVLVKANDARIRNVEIVGRNGEFAIIKSVDKNVDKQVTLYDTYVINPSNIEEGQLIIK